MAEFKKVNDTQVELHASPEEWDAIKTLLAYAGDNYNDLELEYKTSIRESQYFKNMRDFFTTNPPPTCIFYIDDASILRITISICIYDSKKIFRTDKYLKIYENLDNFNFQKEFNIPNNLEDYHKFIEKIRETKI